MILSPHCEIMEPITVYVIYRITRIFRLIRVVWGRLNQYHTLWLIQWFARLTINGNTCIQFQDRIVCQIVSVSLLKKSTLKGKNVLPRAQSFLIEQKQQILIDTKFVMEANSFLRRRPLETNYFCLEETFFRRDWCA